MRHSIKQLKEKSVPMPITQSAREIAEIFASEQPTASKRRQVYLNTLAVCIVNNYMEIMKVPTEFKQSDSWHPAVRLCADVADLRLAEVGHLECRPINMLPINQSNTVLYHLPLEIPPDRIGCMIVELDEAKRRANLLGFTKNVSSGSISSTDLFDMEEFIEYLDELSGKEVESVEHSIDLSQWISQIFPSRWLSLDNLVSTGFLSPAINFRAADATDNYRQIKRGKLIEVGVNRPEEVVVLILMIPESPYTFAQDSAPEILIKVRLETALPALRLPPRLHIEIIEAVGVAIMAAQTTENSNIIELEFTVEPEEHFSVKLTLRDESVVENFVI